MTTHARHVMAALMIAAYEGQTEIVRLLVASAADVSAADGRGRRAADYAAEAGHADLLPLLGAPAGAQPRAGGPRAPAQSPPAPAPARPE